MFELSVRSFAGRLHAMSCHAGSVSICDRLKYRYGNYQQDWEALFQERAKGVQNVEFIRYVVNFIIEQAKHHIAISEVRMSVQGLLILVVLAVAGHDTNPALRS